MSHLPDTRPDGCREARIRDAWPLLLISLASMVLITWRFPVFRWFTLSVLGLVALEIVVFALLGAADLSWALVFLMPVLVVLSAAVLVVHNLWRVIDPGRIVLLAPDRRACLDVIFKSRGRITLANHCRAFGATSAPGLRRDAAEWLGDLDGIDLDIRAQNMRVATHYVEQFPQLHVLGRDWMGHVRLGLLGVPEEASTPA